MKFNFCIALIVAITYRLFLRRRLWFGTSSSPILLWCAFHTRFCRTVFGAEGQNIKGIRYTGELEQQT